MLAGYDITFVTLKSMRATAFSVQLEEFLSDEVKGKDPRFPDEDIMNIEDEKKWQLFFDVAANEKGLGIVMLLIS